MQKQVMALLAEVFEVPEGTITPDMSFGDIPQWDSMGHMNLMMILEEKFGVEVSAEVIGGLTNVPIICDFLESHRK